MKAINRENEVARQFDLFWSDPDAIRKDEEAFLKKEVRRFEKTLDENIPSPVTRQRILRGFVQLHVKVNVEAWMKKECKAFGGKTPELAAIQDWENVKAWMRLVKQTPKPHRQELAS